jgi:hypothetical protein
MLSIGQMHGELAAIERRQELSQNTTRKATATQRLARRLLFTGS